MKKIDLKSVRATPWKNGGGTTRELAVHPQTAGLGDFIWRFSIADVSESGAFSNFAGIDRIITLIDGDGMRLEGDCIHDLTTRYEPFSFRGEASVQATLIGSACRDFNLMLRRESVSGTIDIWRDARTIPAAHLIALVAFEGGWELDFADDARYVLEPDTALIVDGQHGTVHIRPTQPDSVLLGAQIVSRSDIKLGARHGR